MISITIQDSTDSMTFDNAIEVPLTLSQIINEADVQTIDGNISTYYGSTKRQYQFKLGWMDAESYAALRGFRDRQYANLKYPSITITGNENISVNMMTAKIAINDQEVADHCGAVEGVVITLRESKQMP